MLWEEEEEVGGGEDGCVKVEEGEEGEVEELDYDETMEDLDLHPTGNIDEAEGDEARRHSVTSDARPGQIESNTYFLTVCICACESRGEPHVLASTLDGVLIQGQHTCTVQITRNLYASFLHSRVVNTQQSTTRVLEFVFSHS